MGFKAAWKAVSGLLSDQKLAGEAQGQGQPDGEGPGTIELVNASEGNSVHVGKNTTLIGKIVGRGNLVRIEDTQSPQTLMLNLIGNNNEVVVGAGSLLQNLRVEIGSERWPSSQTRLRIGKGFSIASHGRFLLPNSGNVLQIGDNCMFSSNIVVRGGEYPHLIFDRECCDYLDVSDGIFIGDHVWVGEGAFIGKSVTLPDDTIVGTRSVVTKRFEETHCVVAGNPARIVKRGVQWVANEFVLEDQLPEGFEKFGETDVARINRAEREQNTPD